MMENLPNLIWEWGVGGFRLRRKKRRRDGDVCRRDRRKGMMERNIIAFRRPPPSRRLLVNPHLCRPVFSTHLIHSEVACIP